jgi:Lon protease-like protein
MTEPFSPDELAALPIFPLPDVVFFPSTTLALHIFEPRYRAMMEDCLAHGPAAMAVALLAPGWEEDYDGRPPIRTIAGAGRISQHVRRPDGRFDVLLSGVARVSLVELPEEGRPYRRARATPIPERIPHPDAVERLVPTVMTAASSIAGQVRRHHPDFELGVDATTMPGVLADRVADRLIADVERRQELLEQADVKVRLALLGDWLLELYAMIAPARGNLS